MALTLAQLWKKKFGPKPSKVPAGFKAKGPTKFKAAQNKRVRRIQAASRKNSRGGGAMQGGSTSRPLAQRGVWNLPGLGTPSKPKKKKKKTVARSNSGTTGARATARARVTRSSGSNRSTVRRAGGGGRRRRSRPPRTAGNSGAGAPAIPDDLKIPEYPTINYDAIFGGARRELDRRQRVAKARYDMQQRDLQVFNDWLASKQAESEASLQQANQGYLDQAAQARQQSLDTIKELISRAMAGVGGNAGIAQAAGITAQTESTAAAQAAGDARQQYLADMAKADQTDLANQREVNAARAARLLSDINNQYTTSAEEIAQAGSELDRQIAEAILQDQQAEAAWNRDRVLANRQYGLDKSAAEWLQGYRDRELASNERVAMARTRAEQMVAKLDNQLEQRKMNLREAELEIKRSNLSRQEKNAAIKRLRQARQDRRAWRDKALNQVNTFIQAAVRGYGKKNLGELNRHDYGQVAHRTIAMLGGAYPQLTRAEVVQLISSQFGSDVATDERILRDIAARFRR